MSTNPILSIIIVSYGAKYFLDVTLFSIYDLIDDLSIEIIVIDNSDDNSIADLCRTFYPKILFIKSPSNIGFSKANNLGVQYAHSDNLLFLNPDVIISKDCIITNSQLLTASDTVAAITVRMIDGSGEYLPESKRKFPNIISSFGKLFGLDQLFNVQNSYYSEAINGDNLSFIEVFAGACIFIKKSIFNLVGQFDERYFMYGEDIDLSFQIHSKGYQILYNPTYPIIHFKGESTQKKSWKYHQAFYGAMNLYWTKIYENKYSKMVNLIVKLAVFGLKISSFIVTKVSQFLFPVLDFVFILGSLLLFTSFWSVNYKGIPTYYTPFFYYIILPIYTLIWIFALILSSWYDRDINLYRLFRGAILGTSIILILYFLVPEHYRYSRAIVVFGAFCSMIIPWLIRLFAHHLFHLDIRLFSLNSIKFDFIGDARHTSQFKNLFDDYSNIKVELFKDPLSDIAIDLESNTSQDIIDIVNSNIKKKIWFYRHSRNYIILSHSKKTNGYVISEESTITINRRSNRIIKRFFDILFSSFIFLLALILFLISWKKSLLFFSHIQKVLFQNYSWVSIQEFQLYSIKKGIFTPFTPMESKEYIRNYSFWTDLIQCIKTMLIL